MGEYYIGEIRLFPYYRIPGGWVPCDGRILAVQQNQALFSIISNRFGGDGRTNFALPDLRGRAAVLPRPANPTGMPLTVVGNMAGEESHALTMTEMPDHNHQMNANADPGVINTVAGNVWAAGAPGQNLYAPDTSPLVPMADATVAAVGNGGKHNNMQPFLVLNYCIAISGIYPPHND